MRKSFYETLIIVLIAAAVFFGLRFAIQTYIVSGPSMESNYHNNEWIVVNKLAYKFTNPQRGDIIIFQPPISSTQTIYQTYYRFTRGNRGDKGWCGGYPQSGR